MNCSDGNAVLTKYLKHEDSSFNIKSMCGFGCFFLKLFCCCFVFRKGCLKIETSSSYLKGHELAAAVGESMYEAQ